MLLLLFFFSFAFAVSLLLKRSTKMTRQNVPLDPKSRISVTLEMTIPKSSSFLTMAAQKPPPVPSGCITNFRKKRVSNIEINGEARINSWLDSMKASSPTHIKATPLTDCDPSSFIVSIRLSLCSRKEGFFFFWFLVFVVLGASPIYKDA